ncbi:MAG: DinB family protein [Anaerolineae bacterium]|nr:DinB family protein [Anaerolineae bacterium]
MPERRQYLIEALPARDPEIGRWLWMIDDARRRTRRALDGLDERAVDWQKTAEGHSIGTLLYHIAAIEIDWLGTEVLESKLPSHVWDHFPYEVRDEQDQLMHVPGVSLADHWQRLDFTRALLMDTYQQMSLEDFRRARVLEAYDVTPEWVLHHLCQHEAEHRDEMIALREGAQKSLGLE